MVIMNFFNGDFFSYVLVIRSYRCERNKLIRKRLRFGELGCEMMIIKRRILSKSLLCFLVLFFFCRFYLLISFFIPNNCVEMKNIFVFIG